MITQKILILKNRDEGILCMKNGTKALPHQHSDVCFSSDFKKGLTLRIFQHPSNIYICIYIYMKCISI